MRNKPLMIVFPLAIVFGLITAFSINSFLNKARLRDSLARIVVAKVEIPPGAKISKEQLATVEVAKSMTPEGTFDSVDKVIGRISSTRITAREPLTGSRLASENSLAGLSAIIPEGFRAITVKIDDETGVAGFILPGATVDVLAVINSPVGNQEKVSKIVLQNIKVLANGQNLDQPEDERKANSVRNVTLMVDPEQAEKLALSTAEGKLQLVMRNSTDQKDEKTPGANRYSLLMGKSDLGLFMPSNSRPAQPKTALSPRPAARPAPALRADTAPPAAAPAPAPRISIEVIDGGKRKIVEFPLSN